MTVFIKVLAFLISLLAVINISNFNIILDKYYYYFGFGITLFVLLLISKKIKINYLLLWLVIASLLSIVFNRIPAIFSPYYRFLAFIVLISLIGPLLSSKTLSSFRTYTFNTINFLIIILVNASYVGLLLDVPFVYGSKGFNGFFNHPMVLGPMAAISMLSLIKIAYSSKNKLQRFIYIILVFISFLVCVKAGSRAALVAGIAGTLFFVYKINQQRLTRFLTFSLIISSVLILSYPLWEQYADQIISKMRYAEQKGDLTISRTALWGLRLEEFRSSPVIGVGFVSLDVSILSNRFDPYEGKVEPGSSWLAGLSMIGLLGFTPFFILVFGYLKFLVKDNETVTKSAYLGSLIVLFFFHMVAEGYIFSAGSGLFFYFWLMLGVIDKLKNQINFKNN